MSDIQRVPSYWEKYGVQVPAEYESIPAVDYRKYLAVQRALNNEIARLEGMLYENKDNGHVVRQLEDAKTEAQRLQQMQNEAILSRPTTASGNEPEVQEPSGGSMTADAMRRRIMSGPKKKPFEGVAGIIQRTQEGQ